MRDDDDEQRGRWPTMARFLRRIPRQARSWSVVRAILEAAEEELAVAESGPLQPLFARAGVAAGSFYEYFASREALLGAVVEHVTDRNFESLLTAIDAATAHDRTFETATRRGIDIVVRHYLRRPDELGRMIRIADRLGLLPRIARERDRFADAMAERAARFTPELDPEARCAMMRAGSDALMGVLVIASVREPRPSVDEIAALASDAAWGVLAARLASAERDRARS